MKFFFPTPREIIRTILVPRAHAPKMRRTFLLLLLSLLAVSCIRAQCPGAIVDSCGLAPYQEELSLQNQVFCPEGGATGLELPGSGCSSLQYCCNAFTSFTAGNNVNIINVVGAAFKIGDGGSIVIGTGKEVKIDFPVPACVARISISTNGVVSQGSARISRYYQNGIDPASAVTDAPLSPDGSASVVAVDECNLLAISIRAPNDAALVVQGLSVCLIGAQSDSCGVCNGNGASCGGTAAASVGGNGTVSIQTAVNFPIIPFIGCHERVDDLCCTVWSYENDNTGCVVIAAGIENFFVPPNHGQTTTFIPGGQDLAFTTWWNCTQHINIHLKWQVNTLTTYTGSIVDISDAAGRWPNGVQVHRQNKEGCPDGYCFTDD